MIHRPLVLVISLLAAVLPWQEAEATEPAWEYSFEGPVAAQPVDFGDLILVAGGNALAALDSEGAIAWEVHLAGTVLSTPAVAGDRIYIHTSAGLTALDSDREVLWAFESEDKGAIVDGRSWGWGDALFSDPWAFYRSSPVVTDAAIVFADSSRVHALNPQTGTVLWQQPTAPVTADIVTYEDSVVVADWSNRLKRINLADGAVQWTFYASLPATYSQWIGWTGLNLTPAIADDRVYLGSRGTYFYAINLETGKESWSNKHGTSWIGSAAVIHGDALYFGLSDGQGLVGINRPSGNQTLFVPAPGPVFATPVVWEKYLIAGTLRGELLIVDLDAGHLISTHQLQDSPRSYNSYFQPEPDSTLSPYEFTVQQMNVMKREQESILSMSIIRDLLIVGTGSGEVKAFTLADLVISN